MKDAGIIGTTTPIPNVQTVLSTIVASPFGKDRDQPIVFFTNGETEMKIYLMVTQNIFKKK